MIRRWVPVIVAYSALTLVMSWPYIDYTNFGTASYGGDQRLIIWTLAWDNHAVLSRLPLFDSNIFFPATDSLRYNEHLFGVSLFTLPLAAAGASPVLAHNVVWLLAWLLNGLATYGLLLRYVRSGIAAFVGSLAFVCSFYVMLHAHAHLHLMWLWPLPLSLLLLERWFDTPRWSTLAAWSVVFTLGVLTSWYVAVMMLVVNATMALVLLVAPPDRDSPRTGSFARAWSMRTLQMGVAIGVVAASVAPFAVHYVGMRGAEGEALASSATLASYLVPAENTFVGQWWLSTFERRPGSIWGEQTLFAGWLTLALATVGLLVSIPRCRPTPRAMVFPVLVVVGVLLSLGPQPQWLGGHVAPFAWLTSLPGFEGMRAPARFGAVAMLGIAGLVARAIPFVARTVTPSRPLAVCALVPFMLAEWFVIGFPAGKPKPLVVPAIYLTPEVLSTRALMSLPEYWGQPDWVLGGDYLYFSMSHWRPIVNGFGRTGPGGYDELIRETRDFPSSLQRLRGLGVEYVVLHGDRYPRRGEDVVRAAIGSGCRPVRQVGNDYLYATSACP